MHVIMDQLYEELGRISQKYDFTEYVNAMSEYADKKMQEFTVAKGRQRQATSDMANLQKMKVNINERIKQIEAKIKNPEKLRLGLEKFSNSLNM